VDFSFLQEIADHNSEYIHEVLDIFLTTMPDGLRKLERLIAETEDFDGISKQAHFLKSSVGVVRVKGMYEHLAAIENMARQHRDLEEIRRIAAEITALYRAAHPLVLHEREKHRPAQI